MEGTSKRVDIAQGAGSSDQESQPEPSRSEDGNTQAVIEDPTGGTLEQRDRRDSEKDARCDARSLFSRTFHK
eukprot:7488751-Pyramimonas_sp.AAC.1